jgi:hypothetical protein
LQSCRYSGDTNIMPMCVYISRHGTHTKHNLWHPKSHTIACTALTDSNPLAAANSLRSILTHTAFCTHAMFTGLKKMQAYPNLDMYPNCYLHVAPYNTNPTMYFDRLTSNQKNWITALWSCLDRFTTWHTIFKLHCSLVHSSYPPTQWYHYT